jgi:hypothetical protein
MIFPSSFCGQKEYVCYPSMFVISNKLRGINGKRTLIGPLMYNYNDCFGLEHIMVEKAHDMLQNFDLYILFMCLMLTMFVIWRRYGQKLERLCLLCKYVIKIILEY